MAASNSSVKNRIKLDSTKRESPKSILWDAVVQGDNEKVSKFLLNNKYPQAIKDIALERAVSHNQVEVVKSLLRHDERLPLGTGYDACLKAAMLRKAVVLKSVDLVEWLLVHDADPNLSDEYGKTAYTLAEESASPEILDILEQQKPLPCLENNEENRASIAKWICKYLEHKADALLTLVEPDGDESGRNKSRFYNGLFESSYRKENPLVWAEPNIPGLCQDFRISVIYAHAKQACALFLHSLSIDNPKSLFVQTIGNIYANYFLEKLGLNRRLKFDPATQYQFFLLYSRHLRIYSAAHLFTDEPLLSESMWTELPGDPICNLQFSNVVGFFLGAYTDMAAYAERLIDSPRLSSAIQDGADMAPEERKWILIRNMDIFSLIAARRFEKRLTDELKRKKKFFKQSADWPELLIRINTIKEKQDIHSCEARLNSICDPILKALLNAIVGSCRLPLVDLEILNESFIKQYEFNTGNYLPFFSGFDALFGKNADSYAVENREKAFKDIGAKIWRHLLHPTINIIAQVAQIDRSYFIGGRSPRERYLRTIDFIKATFDLYFHIGLSIVFIERVKAWISLIEDKSLASEYDMGLLGRILERKRQIDSMPHSLFFLEDFIQSVVRSPETCGEMVIQLAIIFNKKSFLKDSPVWQHAEAKEKKQWLSTTDEYGRTAFWYAVSEDFGNMQNQGNASEIIPFIIKFFPTLFSERLKDCDGNTLLHDLVRVNKVERIRYLKRRLPLFFEEYVNHENQAGWVPFAYAIQLKNRETIDFFKEKEQIFLCTQYGLDNVVEAIICFATLAELQQLIECMRAAYNPVRKQWLLQVNYYFFIAVRQKRLRFIELFLHNEADIHAQENIEGITALMIAAAGGDLNIVAFLYEYSQNHTPERNRGVEMTDVTDKNGWHPLTYAVVAGHEKVVQYLLPKTSMPELQDVNGMTALLLAMRAPVPNYTIIDTLLSCKRIRDSHSAHSHILNTSILGDLVAEAIFWQEEKLQNSSLLIVAKEQRLSFLFAWLIERPLFIQQLLKKLKYSLSRELGNELRTILQGAHRNMSEALSNALFRVWDEQYTVWFDNSNFCAEIMEIENITQYLLFIQSLIQRNNAFYFDELSRLSRLWSVASALDYEAGLLKIVNLSKEGSRVSYSLDSTFSFILNNLSLILNNLATEPLQKRLDDSAVVTHFFQKIIEKYNSIAPIDFNALLFFAVYFGQFDILNWLIDNMKNPPLDSASIVGFKLSNMPFHPMKATLLMCAVFRKNMSMINFLLEKGANPDIQGENGDTAIMYALKKKEQDIAIRLLQQGKDLSILDDSGENLFSIAMRESAFSFLKELVQKINERGAGVNHMFIYKASEGTVMLTALGLAVQMKRLDFVGLLLEKKADPNSRIENTGDRKSYQPLVLFSAKEKRLDIVHALLEAGANPEIPDSEGSTLYDVLHKHYPKKEIRNIADVKKLIAEELKADKLKKESCVNIYAHFPSPTFDRRATGHTSSLTLKK